MSLNLPQIHLQTPLQGVTYTKIFACGTIYPYKCPKYPKSWFIQDLKNPSSTNKGGVSKEGGGFLPQLGLMSSGEGGIISGIVSDSGV